MERLKKIMKMNKKQDFIESYFIGFKKIFPDLTIEVFEKYHDESIYSGYPDDPSGSMWDSEGRSIYVLIRILKPKRILEIGNFKGVSSNHILQAVENNGFGYVVLDDIEERIDYSKIHNNNFKRIIQDSLKYLDDEFEFDLIIQDGNHTHQHVKKEIELILKNNKMNSFIIWGHDYYQRSKPTQCSVWKAWDEMKNKFNEFEGFKDSISNCGFLIAKK